MFCCLSSPYLQLSSLSVPPALAWSRVPAASVASGTADALWEMGGGARTPCSGWAERDGPGKQPVRGGRKWVRSRLGSSPDPRLWLSPVPMPVHLLCARSHRFRHALALSHCRAQSPPAAEEGWGAQKDVPRSRAHSNRREPRGAGGDPPSHPL